MSVLFEPIKIGNIEMRNRFMRSATYFALADDNGMVGDKSASLMKTLASNDVGLIVTGYAYVQKNGQCFVDQNGIHTDDHIAGYKNMTKAVHDAGGKIVMQIAHGGIGARYTDQSGEDFVAVSVPEDQSGFKTPPRLMTDEDIEGIIESFGKAARRVQEAGFDGVQIHGAHGYLVTQFLSPQSNQRGDQWGGSLENRMKFVVETARSMKKQVTDDFPMMIKLGCRDYVDDDNRLTIEEGAAVVNTLQKEGVCHVEISHGTIGNTARRRSAGITRPDQEAFMLPDADFVRKETDGIQLGLVGGMRSLPVMEKIVESGTVDTISICRPLIREPDLIMQWKNGATKSADCISCGRCFNRDNRKMSIRCSQKDKKTTEH